MAKREKLVVFGRGGLAESTAAYLRSIHNDFEVVVTKKDKINEAHTAFICVDPRWHSTDTVNLKDINYIIGDSGNNISSKCFYIRTHMTPGQCAQLNYRYKGKLLVSYFPNFFKSDEDFTKIPIIVSSDNYHLAAFNQSHEFIFKNGYHAIHHTTLELAVQMTYALRAIDTTAFCFLQEFCVAEGVSFAEAVQIMMIIGESRGYFTGFSAMLHKDHEMLFKMARNMGHIAGRRGVFGKVLLDLVDGLNDHYFKKDL